MSWARIYLANPPQGEDNGDDPCPASPCSQFPRIAGENYTCIHCAGESWVDIGRRISWGSSATILIGWFPPCYSRSCFGLSEILRGKFARRPSWLLLPQW